MLEIGGKPLLSRLIEMLEPRVARVHVVVGYREELIINLCANFHRKVVIVRNPDYRITNTAYSNALGANGCSGKVLFADGDLVIDPRSMMRFLDCAAENEVTAGITRAHSERPVYANTKSGLTDDTGVVIQAFSDEKTSAFEWANVVAGPSSLMNDANGYVFERLKAYLPLPACELVLREIDTPKDLEKAKAFVKTFNEHRS
jgi:choline kinase